MMFEFITFLTLFIAVANAYQMSRKMSPMTLQRNSRKLLELSVCPSILGSSVVLSPRPAFADGTSSISTIYRGRNYYGPTILKLEEAVKKATSPTRRLLARLSNLSVIPPLRDQAVLRIACRTPSSSSEDTRRQKPKDRIRRVHLGC